MFNTLDHFHSNDGAGVAAAHAKSAFRTVTSSSSVMLSLNPFSYWLELSSFLRTFAAQFL